MPPAATLPGGQTIRQQTKAKDRASADRNVVKAVLSNPLAVPWPSLPNHLQTSVLAALPQIIPPEVSDYHVSRARCSRAVKVRRKKEKHGKETTVAIEEPPAKPASLDHLVLGLNETIKALEHGIDDLRLRMMVMTDALEGVTQTPATPRLLPTAPPAQPEAETEASAAAEPTTPASPLAFVLVPHLSVSPMALIEPLPTYCATYNTLLRQHAQLAKAVRSRVPRPDRYIRPEGPEMRVVPLGAREAEIAATVGLRRVAAFAVRASHPALDVLERLLPQSILVPPRHSITLPFPTTTLRVHDGDAAAAPKPKTAAPLPPINYSALHIKAVHTTAPLDTNGRKAKRMAEVRTKRIQKRDHRRKEREVQERAFGKELKGRKGKPGARAERIAAKKAQVMDVDA